MSDAPHTAPLVAAGLGVVAVAAAASGAISGDLAAAPCGRG